MDPYERAHRALAQAARDLGADVTLITTVSLPAPAGATVLQVNTAQEMHRLELHLRAWSYFEVMLEDDRERFVSFLAGLREARPARQAMLEAMTCEPEEFDRRWADRLPRHRQDQ